MKPITLYGLRHKKTKKPLAVGAYSNDGADDAVSVSYQFQTYYLGDQIWLVDRKEKVEYVLRSNTPWYNADYTTPEYKKDIEIEEYEIFEVTIQ